jgi:hypothetical protein
MAYETNGWNGDAHGPVLFTNVRILDATGEYPYTGEALIQGNRIKHASGSLRRAMSRASQIQCPQGQDDTRRWGCKLILQHTSRR